MKEIVVTDEAAGSAGMTLVERPEPDAAGNDVVVEVHASGLIPGEALLLRTALASSAHRIALRLAGPEVDDLAHQAAAALPPAVDHGGEQ